MQIINIGAAYGIAELILSIFVKRNNLLKIDRLVNYPTVALLYVTYNDAIPEILSKLKNQTYTNYDVFVLDDSTDKKYKKLIDESGFSILRREFRTGFKAGSLNNWISLYGDRYDYFVIADSDSVFDDDFTENMVKYGEHSSNKKVAIFQSKILPWNTKNEFSRILSTMVQLSVYFSEKLGNECSTIISSGHNNLHRTKMIKEVNGFDENFVAEDYATGLNLIKNGYECKMVDVISYDTIPEKVQSYNRRYIRWAKQTIELLKFDTENIPFNTKLHLFIGVYSYIIYIIFLFGMFLIVWGYDSSFSDLVNLSNFMISGEFLNARFFLPFMLIVFYILNFSFLRLPLALKLGISVKDYCKSLILNTAINWYMMFSLIKEELKVISGRKVHFEVTDKNKNMSKSSLIQIIMEMRYSVLLNIFIFIGLLRNPVVLIFNFLWLIPLLISPLVIYLVQREEGSWEK